MSFIFLLYLFIFTISWQQCDDQAIKEVLDQKLQPTAGHLAQVKECPNEEIKKATLKQLSFNYKDKQLDQLINEIASLKKINIILPQAKPITTKVTVSFNNRLSIDEAWSEVERISTLAGYGFTSSKNGQIEVFLLDKDIARQHLPLYINTPLENLPDNDQIITAMFFLANLKLSGNENDKKYIQSILEGQQGKEGMLSAYDNKTQIKYLEDQNALIITDKADVIKSAMKIILALDVAGIPDAIEVVPLFYTSAAHVEELFTQLLPKKDSIPTALSARNPETKRSTYFPDNTKVVGLGRTNAVVIMGTVGAIRDVKDFLIKYIDHPLESGKSILHVYDLQYLDAEKFAPQLSNLVKGQTDTGQAEVKSATGPQQYFKDVIIIAEPTKQIIESVTELRPSGAPTAGAPSAQAEGVAHGGNRLIIASRSQDWTRIKDLIKKLDTPQPQVALEVLLVDLTITDEKLLGSQMRNPAGLASAFNNNFNFQSAHLDQAILLPDGPNTGGNNPQFLDLPANALMANLLSFVSADENFDANLASGSTPGTTVFSLRDPNTSSVWNVWKVLNQFTNAILLAQPFITTLDNQQATIAVSEDRFLTGGAAAEAGAVDIKNEYVKATISIDLLPRISMEGNNVNLDVVINVNEFLSGSNSRITRLVQTNANVGDNEVLAIGGLIRMQDTVSVRETPLLGNIPLIGWFFKQKNKIKQKNNLLVFISPIIIEPRKQGGIGEYSERKLCFAEQEIEETINFQNLRDPITRWFFRPDIGYAKRVTSDYVHQRVFDELPNNELLTIAHNNNSEVVGQSPQTKNTQNPVLAHNEQQPKNYKQKAKSIQRLLEQEDSPLSIEQIEDQCILNA